LRGLNEDDAIAPDVTAANVAAILRELGDVIAQDAPPLADVPFSLAAPLSNAASVLGGLFDGHD
jgi:hypothetical protein